jgi:hypothetical protein
MRTQRLKTGAYKSKELATRPARRVPPPLRFGAALVYVLIHPKPAGRDVGLAKSGLRPTDQGSYRPFPYVDAYAQLPPESHVIYGTGH